MPNVGPLEIVIVLIIVLVIFGPKRLPEMGRSLGRGIREFKGSLTKDHEDEPPRVEENSKENSKVESGEAVSDHRS